MSSAANFTTSDLPEILTVPPFPEINFHGSKWTATVVLAILMLWRWWKFTLHPFLFPEQPKEFPYWTPFLGHGLAFFRNSNDLISRARRHFNNAKEPFALTAFGMTFYVVTQSKHSAEVYKNTETLSFEGFVQGLMRINGNNTHAIRVMYNPLPSSKPGFPNPHAESLGVLAQKMHIHQLHPGNNNLIHLQRKAQEWINGNLTMEALAKNYDYAVLKDTTQMEVPLYQWCSDLFVQLGQQVYFGETLAKIEPKVHQSFLVFDELIWKILYQYPSFLSADMAAGRGEVVAALRKYLRTPKSERSDAAWIISAMEDEMMTLGVEVEDMAIIIFHLYIA